MNADREALLEQAVESYLEAIDHGRDPDLDGLAARYPDVADDLRAFVAGQEELRRLAGLAGSTADEAAPADTASYPGAGGAPVEMPRPGTYEKVERLAEGGMGTVYKAFDPGLQRWVALKCVRPDRVSARALGRFVREGQAVARLSHPHIVQVFGWSEYEGQPALVLEYVPGGTLARALARRRLIPEEAARLLAVIARAVQHAHERGIVHRDLKPGNVLLADNVPGSGGNTAVGFPKVGDFGLARLAEAEGATGDGDLLGTVHYMAPEQAEGNNSAVGPPADVWALGVMLYEVLAGRLPFRGDSAVQTLRHIVERPAPPLRSLAPDVPEELAALCHDCLDRDPTRRPTAAVLAERLERFHDAPVGVATLPEPPARQPRTRPRRWAVLAASGLAVVALVAGLGYLARQRGRDEVAVTTPTPSSPVQAPAVAIKPLRVQLYQTDGQEAVARGQIGDRVYEAKYGDAVTLGVELGGPAYCYVIGFNFDGREQLLWPVDDKGQPSDVIPPPRLDRLRYPAGQTRLYLDDDEEGGLQVYAVAASGRPLPPYAEWRKGREVNWQRLPAGKKVWEADARAAYEVVPGLGPDRGSLKEPAGVPPLARLCRGLLGGEVEAVEAFGFPVRARGEKP